MEKLKYWAGRQGDGCDGIERDVWEAFPPGPNRDTFRANRFEVPRRPLPQPAMHPDWRNDPKQLSLSSTEQPEPNAAQGSRVKKRFRQSPVRK